jgi:hypothetical protein
MENKKTKNKNNPTTKSCPPTQEFCGLIFIHQHLLCAGSLLNFGGSSENEAGCLFFGDLGTQTMAVLMMYKHLSRGGESPLHSEFEHLGSKSPLKCPGLNYGWSLHLTASDSSSRLWWSGRQVRKDETGGVQWAQTIPQGAIGALLERRRSHDK